MNNNLEIIPIVLENGRLSIPGIWCITHPEVDAFCKRFGDYWTYDFCEDGYVSPLPEIREETNGF